MKQPCLKSEFGFSNSTAYSAQPYASVSYARRSKLHGRQLFKIIRLCDKDGEPWATILKSQSQLRAKEYQAKIAELLAVPGQVFSYNDTPDLYPTEETNGIQAPLDTYIDKGSTNRPKRQSAKKAKELISHMDTKGVLRIGNKRATMDIPHHGWNWETFNQLLMEDSDITTRPRLAKAYILDDLTDSQDQ